MNSTNSTLLERLKAGTKNYRETKWPGTNETILIGVLTEEDQLKVTLATDEIWRSAGLRVDHSNVDAYEAEKNNQLLFRVIKDPETKGPIDSSITEFRQLLSEGVRAILLDEVFAYQCDVNPSPYNMTDEQFDSLYMAVKKNAKATVGNISNIACARKLIVTMAAEHQNSQTDSGSSL